MTSEDARREDVKRWEAAPGVEVSLIAPGNGGDTPDHQPRS